MRYNIIRIFTIMERKITLDKYLEILNRSVLFRSIDLQDIKALVYSIPYNIETYNKDDIIAIEDDDCTSLGIILKGCIEIHKPFPSGKIVTINNFQAGNVFGEAIIFSGTHRYPANVISSTESKVMYIDKDQIIRLMTLNDKVLNNFLSVLSNRILMLNDRLTNLSLDTVRKKISNIILTEYEKQGKNLIILPFCRRKMAEMLNIPRPSLSRELSKMKMDGIIDFNKNKVRILDMDLLEASLVE